MPKAKPPKPEPPATMVSYHLENQWTRLEMFAASVASGLASNYNAGLLNSPSAFATLVLDLASALDARVDEYQ